MQLPKASNNYAYQMRSNFARYCAPCQNYLVHAVETTYKQTDFHSQNHDWLQARVDMPDLFSSEKDPCPSSQSKSRSQLHLDGPTGDSKEEQEFSRYPEATKAAIRARMKVNLLEPAEMNHCLFMGNESHLVHVDIRNHIIRMWYREPQRRLDVFTALVDVPERFHELGCRVFSFLECTGTINFGAIPIMTPIALRRAYHCEKRHRVAVVGGGITGLIAARQLRSFGVSVTVFEARNRPGGRILTEKEAFSTAVDMGAMLITGVVQNPVAILARQTNSPMHFLDSECPLFDIDGKWVSKEADLWAEKEYNAILDATARYRKRESSGGKASKMSLGQAFQRSLEKRVTRRKARISARVSRTRSGLQHARRKDKFEEDDYLYIPDTRRGKVPLGSKFGGRSCNAPLKTPSARSSAGPPKNFGEKCIGDLQGSDPSLESTCLERINHEAHMDGKKSLLRASPPKDEKLISRLLRWHIANLEYACAADISNVSLMHWDQDDPYGFQGEHVLLKSGYEPLLDGLVRGLERNLKYSTEVVSVSSNDDRDFVEIETKAANGTHESHKFDSVLITVPLGVLKEGSIEFRPLLPSCKQQAINRLGSGGLMKVAMEFTRQFWVQQDMFGALRESVEKRGEFYFFWNLVPCTGKLILVAVVAEPCVSAMEERPDEDIVQDAMVVLRRCFPSAPDPIAFAISRWSKDIFAKGAYTNIPVGSSGDDYDILADPVGRVFFGGEHTCRRNPTTCASGVISGLREACRIVEKLGMIPTIAQIHADCLRTIMKKSSRGKSNEGLEYNEDVDSQAPSKRSRLSIEPMTPQSPPSPAMVV